MGGRQRRKRPFPSRSPPRAAPAALAARPPSWPCPAARAGGLPAPDRAGPPRVWAPPGPPWQGLRQAGSVGRVGRPQAWAPAGAGWQGVGGRGRVGLREKWLYFSGIFQNREKVVDSLPGYILAITGYRYNLAMRAKLSIRLSFSTDGTIRPLQSSVGGDGSLKRL